MYNDFINKHTKKINNFEHIFFAFSDKQFKEGIKKMGLTESEDDLKKLIQVSNGGIILKEHYKEFKKMYTAFDEELKEKMKEKDFAIDAFLFELGNHEYCITYDPTDTLESLGLTMKGLDNNSFLADCFKISKNRYQKQNNY